MPKAVVCVKECGVNPLGQVQIVYDFATDYLNPNAGVPLTIGDQAMVINLANSVVQTNAAIRSGVLSMLTTQGFPNTGLATGDITIFGGAQ